MSEKNYLPESGRIDLNNPTDKALQIPESKNVVTTDESQENRPVVDTAPVTVTETSESSDQSINSPETESNAGNIPPSSEDGYETGKINPNILAISAIVAGLLIMSAGYIAYRYFSQESSEGFVTTPIAEVQIDGEDYDGVISDLNGRITSGVSTSRAEVWEMPGDSDGIVLDNTDSDINEIAQQPQAEQDQAPSDVDKETISESEPVTISTSTQSLVLSEWRANDYEFGDISAGTYSVENGDTLWEIAEAVYGDGGDWQKIADANNVSNLSNGNPLIIPGQVLNIPS